MDHCVAAAGSCNGGFRTQAPAALRNISTSDAVARMTDRAKTCCSAFIRRFEEPFTSGMFDIHKISSV
jgi:hypothetical protein